MKTPLRWNLALTLLALTVLSAAGAEPRNAREVRVLLGREVDFKGFDDPKTTLKEALDNLTAVHGLKFKIDEPAFVNDGLKDVAAVQVADPKPLPPMKGVQLDRVLRRLLARIPVPSGASFIISDTQIILTTNKALKTARLRGEPPPALTPAMITRERAVRGRLAKAVDFPGFDDPKTTLKEGLDFLAAKYDLTFEVNEKAFDNEGLKDVLAVMVADPKPIPAMKKTVLTKVLDTVMAKIPVPSKATVVIRPGGHLEITTTKQLALERGGK